MYLVMLFIVDFIYRGKETQSHKINKQLNIRGLSQIDLL